MRTFRESHPEIDTPTLAQRVRACVLPIANCTNYPKVRFALAAKENTGHTGDTR